VNAVPVQLFERGYTALVSVIPPSASLSPGSAITPSQLGKTPGKKLANGTWAGYGWLKADTTLDDVKQWSQDGANIGLRGEGFPAVDIDCTDPWLAGELVRITQRILGAAPLRVGKAPKSLLIYRLGGDPFARMALLIFPEGKGPGKPSHLVEVLGAGRQYLIYGTHPSGSTYTWDREQLPDAADLLPLSKADVERYFTELTDLLTCLPGYEVEQVGDGRVRNAGEAPAQDDLKAPSLEILQQAVSLIPNDEEVTREQYIKIGYAIKAAWADEEDAYSVFAQWAQSHRGSDRVEGRPDTWRTDWRRFHPPFVVGWSWLAEIARRWGFRDAALDFDTVDTRADAAAEAENGATPLSDHWCAHRIIDDHHALLRYVAAEDSWYVWDLGRWVKDAVNLAEYHASRTLERLSAALERHGTTPQEKKEAIAQSRRLASAYVRDASLKFVQSDPRIVIRPEAFDADPWLLNTPGGVVDLRTGHVDSHRAEVLCSKMTAVAPDFDMPIPQWERFLVEATNCDLELIDYLQRVLGYCLTGTTSEQVFWMIWGPGKNGKSVLLNAVAGLFGSYARTAPMDTFTSTSTERHPTELAMLMGARLVSAAETQAGRRWDEQKVKGLTGGDLVSARFMRQDFFTYQPQFKLLFVGNHKPELRDVDPAMRRRIHLIPFTTTPRATDTQLAMKLRAEWPGILAWAVRGCLQWQAGGLATPAIVLTATEGYFGDQDSTGRWLEEVTRPSDQFHTNEALFESWSEWAGRNGEHRGTMRAFVQRLVTKGLERHKHDLTRKSGFMGLQLLNTVSLEGQ
jgi:putative DNA primase/helicase